MRAIRIHEFGMSAGEAFISMELLPGGTLADLRRFLVQQIEEQVERKLITLPHLEQLS